MNCGTPLASPLGVDGIIEASAVEAIEISAIRKGRSVDP